MKYLLLALAALSLTGCFGYSSRSNETIGQVKKVVGRTPLVCSDWTAVDVSLGVMVNGSGSMSHQDLWLYVKNPEMIAKLKAANESGKIVKIKYDTARVVWCVSDHWLTDVEVMP